MTKWRKTTQLNSQTTTPQPFKSRRTRWLPEQEVENQSKERVRRLKLEADPVLLSLLHSFSRSLSLSLWDSFSLSLIDGTPLLLLLVLFLSRETVSESWFSSWKTQEDTEKDVRIPSTNEVQTREKTTHTKYFPGVGVELLSSVLSLLLLLSSLTHFFYCSFLFSLGVILSLHPLLVLFTSTEWVKVLGMNNKASSCASTHEKKSGFLLRGWVGKKREMIRTQTLEFFSQVFSRCSLAATEQKEKRIFSASSSLYSQCNFIPLLFLFILHHFLLSSLVIPYILFLVTRKT